MNPVPEGDGCDLGSCAEVASAAADGTDDGARSAPAGLQDATGESMRRLARAALVVALVFVAACRSAPPGPTAADRAAFGDMAVVVVDDGVRDVPRPVTGWASGLGSGTLRGVAAVPVCAAAGAVYVTVMGGWAAGPWYPVVAACGAATGAVVGVVYTPVSIVGGAVTAASEDAVAEAEPAIRTVLADPSLAGALADAFRDTARKVTGRSFVAPEMAQTVVELRLVAVHGVSPGEYVSYDPPVSIVAETAARVIRRADGAVLWSWTPNWSGPQEDARALRFADWGADGGEALRGEVRRVLAAHGAAYVSLVLVDTPGAPRQGARGTPGF